MTPADRDALHAQLIQHEGIRLKPYPDTVGKLTIGVGRNLTDAGITTPEALTLLDHDIDACLSDLYAFGWFLALDGVRLRAVIDLRFNVGRGAFRTFVKFLDAMERKDYQAASTELAASAWAQQVQPARRDRLMRMIRTGVDA